MQKRKIGLARSEANSSLKVSEFVVSVSNPYLSSSRISAIPLKAFVEEGMEFAFRNKIFPLFFNGCAKQELWLPDQAKLLMREFELRRTAQLEAVCRLVDVCENLGIEFLTFKTLRPFNYVPDDVDILLRDASATAELLGALYADGYQLLFRGTPEITMRKVFASTYVQIDVHTKVAAGHFPLIETEDMWRNRELRQIRGCKIPVLSEHAELVLEAAYSMLKDLRLTPPALYRAVWASTNLDQEKVIDMAIRLGLSVPLFFYLRCCEFFATRILQMGPLGFDRHVLQDGTSMRFLDILHSNQLEKHCEVPYSYPPLIVGYAYLSKALRDVKKQGNLQPLRDLALQPSAKGVTIFMDYLGSLL